MTPEEVLARGWKAVDVVFVTGDAYVDHPSFAMALLGRLLESEGYRVAILSQPNWHSCEPWKIFGRPKICFAISAGNMDSMVNHYTANRKVRNDDAYSPGGRIGRRPDRATLAYCQRARQAYKNVPIVAGGIEASLRRLAHYDYWSDKVRRSIVMDAKPDLIVCGMGERPLIEIVSRLAKGEAVKDLHNIRGVGYRLGAKIRPPVEGSVLLPSYEQASRDKTAFVKMTRMAHLETNPHNARRLVQYHDREAVVITPPSMPLSEAEMDRIYGLPFTRRPHPSYAQKKIPAHEVVKDSIQIMRGCFGGCTFCSIAAHGGRIIQSRSRKSILTEIQRMTADPGFSGVISDIGGPSANMYRMNCSRTGVQNKCRRASCIHPSICKLLKTDHGPLIKLMTSIRSQPGVKRAFVASGIRMDLAMQSQPYIEELAAHNVGGHLKVAPEHVAPEVLQLMRKPPIEQFETFSKSFSAASKRAKKKQYLVPYFIAGHPGSDLSSMIEVALYLKKSGHKIEQVQEFIPGPFDITGCMYHTGLDPTTGEAVYVARGERERRMQKALLLYSKPENYRMVREALETAGRTDLIGKGRNCLISDRPPKNRAQPGRQKGQDGRKTKAVGYRPNRKTAKGRQR